MLVPIKFMVKRIPCADYQEEMYWITGTKDEEKIEQDLKNDKNVLDFFRTK